MSHKISSSTFIRNTFTGAFCLFESMASLLPFVDEMIILDTGSTDGTLEKLYEIAAANPRVKVICTNFSHIDAGAFADIANDCVAAWTYDQGIFWQADEIWHEDLLLRMEEEMDEGHFDLTFWRYQLKNNFQRMKWSPHPVHRVGTRSKANKFAGFNFVGDGMNTNRTWDAIMCSEYGMGWFTRWGSEFDHDYVRLPTQEMILDVSAIGGFLDNIIGKRTLHAPMWHEEPNVDGTPVGEWYRQEKANPEWNVGKSPFNIPHIMEWHVSRPTYELRDELLDALKVNDTRRMLGL